MLKEKNGLLRFAGAMLLLLCFLALVVLVSAAAYALRRRARHHSQRHHEEAAPLLSDSECGSGSHIRGGGSGSGGGDVAAIGTPARDFVRLSSLPPSALHSGGRERRCMACNETGECVELRPCGHSVLCRNCSDFVYTCPHCGTYISGVR